MIDEKKLIESINNQIDWMNNEAKTKSDEDVIAGLKVVLALIDDQEKIGEWIPCEERIPGSLSLVLVQVKGGNIHTMHYLPGYNCFRSENGVMHDLEEISGWIPLPEPYKEELDV